MLMHRLIRLIWAYFLVSTLLSLDLLSQEIIHVNDEGNISEKTAVVILNGFGDTRKNRKHQTRYFETLEYDFFIPKFKVRKSLDASVEKFSDFYKAQNLHLYKEVSVICYIIGGYVLNRHIENHGFGNIKTIIYDRSPIQERAPKVVVDKIKLISLLMIGKVIKQFSEVENLPLKSTPGVNVGLIIENKATPLMRFFKKTSNSYGPYNFNPSQIDPNLDDYFHTRLNHDEMYFRFDVIGPEIEYFLKNGSFTDGAKRQTYSWDMFEKYEE